MPKRKSASPLLIKGSEADKYDRIRDHIINGTELSGTDLGLAKAAKAIYPILVQEMTLKDSVAHIIHVGIATNYDKAVKLVRDTEKIYGRIEKADRDGRKAILIDIAWDALKAARDKAMETGNFNAVERLIDRLAKLGGFYEEGSNIKQIYQQLNLPAPIITDDPKVIDLDEIDVEEDE